MTILSELKKIVTKEEYRKTMDKISYGGQFDVDTLNQVKDDLKDAKNK